MLDSTPMRTASLSRFDLPEIRPATVAFWDALRRRFEGEGWGPLPSDVCGLPFDRAPWREEPFFFGQTPSLAVVGPDAATLRLVGTPRYAAPGCQGPTFRSVVLVRKDFPGSSLSHLKGTRAVIASWVSHSGMNVLRALFAPFATDGRFFSSVESSGSPSSSLESLAANRADVTAIDCVTHALLQKHRPVALDAVRVVHVTPPAPAPPFVTRSSTPDPVVLRMREHLRAVLADPASDPWRAVLLLDGIEELSAAAYAPLLDIPRRCDAYGYHEISIP